MSKKVYLIKGSIRPNSAGNHVAEWVSSQAQDANVDLEVIDLKDWQLPLFDKPYSPQYAEKLDDDILPWADKIAQAEAFIFVTAEYNRGIPASLKSAIDHLYEQWTGKPAVIVSYGYVDGGQSATQHLHDVLDWLKMPIMEPTIAIALKPGDVDAKTGFADPGATLTPHAADLQKAIQALVTA